MDVLPTGTDHEYVYGEIPPVTTTDEDPSLLFGQLALVLVKTKANEHGNCEYDAIARVNKGNRISNFFLIVKFIQY
jgi:hypothetical protein